MLMVLKISQIDGSDYINPKAKAGNSLMHAGTLVFQLTGMPSLDVSIIFLNV